MRAGELRDRVTIQKRSTTKDSYNQTSGSYENVDGWTNEAACVEDLSGTELYKAQSIVAGVTVRITLRGRQGWRSDVKPSARMTSNHGRTFDIKYAVNPDGKNVQLTVLAVEIVR